MPSSRFQRGGCDGRSPRFKDGHSSPASFCGWGVAARGDRGFPRGGCRVTGLSDSFDRARDQPLCHWVSGDAHSSPVSFGSGVAARG